MTEVNERDDLGPLQSRRARWGRCAEIPWFSESPLKRPVSSDGSAPCQ